MRPCRFSSTRCWWQPRSTSWSRWPADRRQNLRRHHEKVRKQSALLHRTLSYANQGFGVACRWDERVDVTMDAVSEPDRPVHFPSETVIYRQFAWTRVTHWVWAISLFFLLLTGLQIFNAHPALYIGDQSGFGFNNDVLKIGAENTEAGPRGYTRLFGAKFDTSGVLGMSGPAERPRYV